MPANTLKCEKKSYKLWGKQLKVNSFNNMSFIVLKVKSMQHPHGFSLNIALIIRVLHKYASVFRNFTPSRKENTNTV